MNLSDLLKTHDRYTKRGTLSGNLGDGYLMSHNPIYASIRNAVLKSGFKLSNQRFFDYDSLSLTQLPKILKQKTIPYCDNVNALREIEKIAPNVFRWAEVPPLRSNHLMHESAHGIARTVKRRFFKESRGISSSEKQRELILSTLIEEAFANAGECMANVYATTEIHDEFLYKNSYIMEKERDRKILRQVMKTIGHRATFRLLLVAYLFSNFQKIRVTDAEFSRVLKVLGVAFSSGLKSAFQIGLRLDPAFTMFTNAFCFRLLGVKQNLREALDFDFLEYLEKDLRFQRWIWALEDVI